MNRIKKIFILVHIILWILFSLLIALQLSQDNTQWLRLTGAVVLTTLYVFYSHFHLLTLYLGKNKKGVYFPRLIAIILTGPVLYMFLHPESLDTFDILYYIISLLTIILPFIFLSWLARITENLVMNTIKKEQLEKQAIETELFYLKAQINPHFLFNTLNNIHTLVYKKAATAPEAVLRLSSLMRYMIYESNAHTVPLPKEIAYLKDYINLQQLRYKNEPIVDLKVSGDTENYYIAPLLFIHFLENAYKHSPGRLEPGDIRVKLEIIENSLIFSIYNPVAGRQGVKEEHGGIGLPNIRKRLQLLYPDAHRLEIRSEDDTYAVRVKINEIHLQLDERKADLLYHR